MCKEYLHDFETKILIKFKDNKKIKIYDIIELLKPFLSNRIKEIGEDLKCKPNNLSQIKDNKEFYKKKYSIENINGEKDVFDIISSAYTYSIIEILTNVYLDWEIAKS